MSTPGDLEDETFYALHHPLRHFRTQSDADAFFDRAWSHAEPRMRNTIVRAFFQKTRRELRAYAGGNGDGDRNGAGVGVLDARVETFLGAADSIHDFGLEVMKWGVFDKHVFPKGFRPAEVVHESAFIRKLAGVHTLRWGSSNMPNPAFKATFLSAPFDVDGCIRAKLPESMEVLWQHQCWSFQGQQSSAGSSFTSSDIWAPLHFAAQDVRFEVLSLRQMAQCIGNLRATFGSCAFVVDASGNSLWSAILGARFLSKTFWRRFVTAPSVQTMQDLEQTLKRFLQTLDPAMDDVVWTLEKVDANLWDAADNGANFPIHPKPTGDVFSPGSPLQIAIRGVCNARNARVRAELSEQNGRAPIALHVTNEQCTRHFSTTHLRSVILNHSHVPTFMDQTYELDKTLYPLSNTMLLAIKRSGDWGQVQHCAKYGAVFWTADRMAALYAHVRGVRFVWTRVREFLNPDPHWPMTDFAPFVQYSFVVSQRSG